MFLSFQNQSSGQFSCLAKIKANGVAILIMVLTKNSSILPKMNSKRLLLIIASLPLFPYGINLCHGFRKKVMLPVQLFFLFGYLIMAINNAKNLGTLERTYFGILRLQWFISNVSTFVTAFKQRHKILHLMRRFLDKLSGDKVKQLAMKSGAYIIVSISISSSLVFMVMSGKPFTKPFTKPLGNILSQVASIS